MSNFIGAVALLSLAIPGFFLNLAVLKKERSSESLALSWLTGSVIFTLFLYLINTYFGISLNHQSSAIALVVFSFVSFLVARKDIALPKIDFKNNKLLIGVPVVIAVLMFATSFFYPVADWDAITLFDFRARMMVNDGFITNKVIEMVYGGYPMYTSLLHFWTYITGLSSPMPVYPLFTISLFAGLFFALRNILNKKISLLIAAASILTPRIFENSFIAYTNLPYTVYITLGALYVYLFVRNKDWESLIIGIFLSLATFWVRSFPFALANFALILLAIPLINKYSKYLSIAAFLLLVGAYFLPITHEVSSYLKWAVFEYYSPYWMIFAGIFIYKIRNSKDWYWALTYIGYACITLVGTYIFSKTWPGYYKAIPDALQRMTMFTNIAVILFASTLLLDQKDR